MCWNRALLVHHTRRVSVRISERECVLACELQLKHARGKILCRRLEWEQGAVSSRVASLLRSAEAKPLFYRFVRHCRTFLSPGQWRCVPPTQAASSCAALAAALAYWYASQPRVRGTCLLVRFSDPLYHLRPQNRESTVSRPICEVKHGID